MANILSRIFRPSAVKAAEGQYRDGPWDLPITGGYLPQEVGKYWNWWQMGYDPSSGKPGALVEACVSAYAQTIAMCPGDHWLENPKGGRDRITNSDLCRIIRKPNTYQTISDYLLNTVRHLYLTGNSYALALRNNRFEVSELHLMNPRLSYPFVVEGGELFFELDGNPVIDQMLDTRGAKLRVPARDVLHIKLNQSTVDPLKGASPLEAAAMQMAAGDAVMAQQLSFYLNQAKPSYVLSTPLPLNAEQIVALRDSWNQQSQGLKAGGTPILTNGLKPETLSMTARDSQLAEMLKMHDQAIANVFRIPLQILGIGGTPFASTEALMQFWIANGLGFILNHLEESIGNFFALKGQPEEYLEFNTRALMRSAFKDQISALTQAVQGAVFSPNEARGELSLERVEHGDEPRVQMQVVPLSFGADQQAAMSNPGVGSHLVPANGGGNDNKDSKDNADAKDAKDKDLDDGGYFTGADLLERANYF